MRKLSMALLAGVALVGCGGVEAQSEQQQIIDNLQQAGFPANDIMVHEGKVYVGRDAEVSLQASEEMLQVVDGPVEEQYRTTNLVDTTTVKKICVVPTATFDSYSQLSAGLDGAIQNYNSQNLAFTLVRGSFADCDATIAAKTTSGVGGNSGFPKGGKPYGTINIGVGLQSYSTGVNTHVVTHEIGHTIGFRHSDYYDRSISCGGSASNEGASTVGAILIPGTPADAKVGGSVMNSCFRSSESGSWSTTDKTALAYLY